MNIERRGDTFKIRISAGTDISGKRITVRETYRPDWMTPTGRRRSDASVEKEVELYAHDLERRVKEGKYNSTAKMTFREFADVWLEQYGKKKLSESGIVRNWGILEKWAFPAFGNKPICDFRITDMQRFADDMQSTGLKVMTIRRNISAVSTIFQFAVRRRILEYNPCAYIEYEPNEKRDIQCFSVAQCKAFLSYLEQPWQSTYQAHGRKIAATGTEFEVRTYTETHAPSKQYIAMFTLLIYSGMRRGELLALTWKDLDFEHRTVSISKAIAKGASGEYIKEPKTKAGIRTLTLPAEVFKRLATWKTEQRLMCVRLGTAWAGKYGADFDDNFVFIQENGKRMSLYTPNDYFKKVIARYNSEHETDPLPDLHLHDLRHCCASMLVESGVPITEISRRLGHAKISTTLDIYSHATAPLDDAASDALERMFSAVNL